VPPPLPFHERAALTLGCLLVSLAIVPRWVAGIGADRMFDDDLDTEKRIARVVTANALAARVGPYYKSGSPRFDGQSAVLIEQLTLLGLGQMVLDHPERRAEYLPAMRAAADRLVDPATLAYATTVYGHHAVQNMAPGEGHAYAGYISMGLGMLRLVDPDNPHARLHDRLDAALRTRLFQSPDGVFETYPGETLPPDVAVVAGAIALHARATGGDVRRDMYAWAERFTKCAVNHSGYVLQRVQSGTCHHLDAPRGSGTALAAYALRFALPDLSFRLYQALADPARGRAELLGFAGIREYAKGYQGEDDLTIGPVVLGASVRATGFALGAARLHEDRETFRELYRTMRLVGVPIDTARGTTFASGGVLGDALLLAMLTTKPIPHPVDHASGTAAPSGDGAAPSGAPPAASGGSAPPASSEPAKGAQ
jgi:hypothetical protein